MLEWPAPGTTTKVDGPDIESETRWPRFAAAAVEAGIGSMMSFQLYTYPAAAGGVGGRGGRRGGEACLS